MTVAAAAIPGPCFVRTFVVGEVARGEARDNGVVCFFAVLFSSCFLEENASFW